MPKFPVDLGRKSPEYGGCPCSPEKSEEPRKYYPSTYISSSEDLSLPDDGVMTVRFRKNNDSSSRPREGKKSYDCSIELVEILSVKPEGESAREDRGAELDKLREEMEDKE